MRVSALWQRSPGCQRRLADPPAEVVGSRLTTRPPIGAAPRGSSPAHAAGATVAGLGPSAPGDSAAAEAAPGAG